MPQIYRVQLSRRAGEHLQNIFEYIEKDSPQNASKTIGRLIKAIDSLEIFPYRYATVKDTEIFGTDVHSMPMRPFLIRYQINESVKLVTILSVRHGARMPGL